MAPLRVIETRDPRGHLLARTRIDQLPATIGRAFDNDVIIDDAYVSPHHARLVQDELGQLWAEDVGSTNGLRRTSHASRESRILLRSGASLVVGHTTVRVFAGDHQVPEALTDQRTGLPVVQLFADRRAVVWAAAVCAGFFCLRSYLGNTTRDPIEDVLPTAIGVLLVCAMWAGFWSLIGRITHAGQRFASHFGWACVGAVGLTLAMTIISWFEFAFPSGETLSVLLGLCLAALFTVFIAGHMTLSSALAPAQAIRRLAVGFGATAAVLALLTYTSHDRFSPSPEYPTAVVPIPTPLLSSVDVDAFAAQALKLQADVDELAKKREREALLPNPMKGL
ncbi:MAG: FHA domain-containing protein [Gemmatimonadaceae bacterium]